MMKDRIVSMAKGLAIVLMVLGHTMFSHYGVKFIYMFHMPLFFFLSGYCFKASYLTDFKKYAFKRIKGAYVPYVKWGILFLLLHNVFYRLHVYDALFGDTLFGIHDYTVNALRIVALLHSEKMLGGYWFLQAYFVASFIFFAVVWLSKNKKKVMCLGGGILLIICSLKIYAGVRVGSPDLLGAFFMIVGYLYKQSEMKLERHIVCLPLCTVLVHIGVLYWSSAMSTVSYMNVVPYCFTAIVGTVMVLSLCDILSRWSVFDKSLSYLGDKTLIILTWHFLCFKLVSLLIVNTNGLSSSWIAEFPVIADYTSKGWWLLYLAEGVLLPLLIYKLNHLIITAYERYKNRY